MSAKRAGKRQRERERRQRRILLKSQRQARAELKPKAKTTASAAGASPDAWAERGAEALRIDDTLAWHIAKMAPGQSTKALDGLKKASIAVFRPRTSEVIVRRGRRVVHRKPLLLRNVFVGVAEAQSLEDVRTLPGIADIASVREEEKEGDPKGNVAGYVMRPARLDPQALQDFADRLAKGEIVRPVGVKAGDKVIVREGSFASFPATVEEVLPCEDPHEPPQVKVNVAIFGRPIPMVLGIAQIEVVN